MNLQKLTTDELSQLIVYISEELEQRRKNEASGSNNAQITKQPVSPSKSILKPATLRDPAHSPAHSPPTENRELQPALKRLKGAEFYNPYEVLSVDDDVENPDDSDAMSDEDFPELNPPQKTNPTRNYPTNTQSPPKETTVQPPHKEKIPPIVLHQKEKWTSVSNQFNERNISFSKAKTSSEGIRIQPNTEQDFRNAIRLLNDIKAEYHTYQLPSEKLLHVVLRGVPEPIPEDSIKDELLEKGFHPESIVRLRRYKDKAPMPLVLITVPKTEKQIFHLKEVARVLITVESQHQKTRINQCFRCLRFGHSQRNCTVKPRCVKCAGEHLYTDCQKTKETPAKCANCGENHTASYRGCRYWPQLRKSKTSPKPVTQDRTYADSAKANTNQSQPQTNNMSPAELFASFQKMYSQMQELAHKLSEMFTAIPQSSQQRQQ